MHSTHWNPCRKNSRLATHARRRRLLPLLEPLEPRLVLSLPGYVVDNRDPTYSDAGTSWRTISGAGYNGDYRATNNAVDIRATATWAIHDLPAGQYQLFVTWVPAATRSPNAVYIAADGSTALTAVHVNQQTAPVGDSAGGVAWKSLGTFPISDQSDLTIRLVDGARGTMSADAIRAVPLTPPAPTPSPTPSPTPNPTPPAPTPTPSPTPPAPPTAPTLTLAGPFFAQVGTAATLIASATYPGSSAVATGLVYTWNFGDGSPAVSGQDLSSVSHLYATPGIYTVQVSATQQGGTLSLKPATAQVLVTNADGTYPSPTGRSPKLIWTPQQQAIWMRMVVTNDPYWQDIKQNADATGTANSPSGDLGLWAMFAFQITGDPVYAQKAYQVMSPYLRSSGFTPDPDFLREFFEQYAIEYDWLYPGLTAAQRQSLIDTLNYWCDLSLGRYYVPGSSTNGIRTADSDVVVGEYFGLVLTALGTAPDNPRAASFLNASFVDLSDGNALRPVGGLDATGVNRDTLRNTLADFAREAAGGTWIESSDYNLGTLKLVMMGIEGVETATGVNHYPELTDFLRQATLEQVYEVTSDLKQPFQWGDEEWERNLKLFYRVPMLSMLGAMFQSDPQVGPYANELVDQLIAKYGYQGWGSAEPAASGVRMFFTYNPDAPTAPLSQLPDGHYSPGMGLLYFHNGWTPQSSAYEAQMSTVVDVDHQVSYFGDFQLYRDGEWAVTHPLGYGNIADTGAATNSMLIAGLSSMTATRGPVAQEFGPNNSYAYIAGTTSGEFYPDYISPQPPPFLQEWTRSLFYLPSADGHSDTVLVFDRVNATDPRTLPDFNRYLPSDQALINAAPSLDQWVIHSPVDPTLTPTGISWMTAGGQDVNVSTLLPQAQVRTVYDESKLWAGSTQFDPSELHWQVRISPSVTQPFETFLNVVQASDPGTQLSNQLVSSDGGEAEGALIHRAGEPDVLVLLGAEPGSRVLSAGYTVSWTSTTSTSQAYLLDLNPSLQWAVRIDGGPVVPLGVSSQGVASITASGLGPHTVQLEVLAGLVGSASSQANGVTGGSSIGTSTTAGAMAIASTTATATKATSAPSSPAPTRAVNPVAPALIRVGPGRTLVAAAKVRSPWAVGPV